MAKRTTGDDQGYAQLKSDLKTGNLRRFIAGEPLLHIVDMEKGY